MEETKTINWWAAGCLGLLILGLGLGILLVNRAQIFHSHAANPAIEVRAADGSPLTVDDKGVYQTGDTKVKLILTSPFGPPVSVSAPTGQVGTASFKVADSPDNLVNAPTTNYSQYPQSVDYQLPPGNGQRFIWVEFHDNQGHQSQASVQLNLLAAAPNPDQVWQLLDIRDDQNNPVSCDTSTGTPVCSTHSLKLFVRFKPTP